MRHVIKKQVLELKLATDKDMFRIQQKAGDYYYQHILPAIEKVLDSLTDEEHVIQINKLEFDLGEMEWEDTRQEIRAENLHQKIEKEAKKIVRRVASPSDGRCQIVQLTKAGNALFAKVFPAHLNHVEQVFADFSQKDLDRMEATLQQLKEAFLAGNIQKAEAA